MTLPDTAESVLALVRRSRLVEDARLAEFRALLQTARLTDLAAVGVLSLMVEQGLLTKYQADELTAGRWWGFWIGGYRVLDRLGKGGMGTVFLAEHALLGKRVAVKVIAGGLQADPAARDRFLREARAAAAVDHPNIVHTYHADVEHDPPYLVMEYVDGVNLQAAVARHGTFAAAEAAAAGLQVAHGLGAAAAAGVVHRDIKPANLLINRNGQMKVLDLGIARFAHDPDSRLVEAEVILGTLDYLAPEQAENCSAVDPRADQYALGATLYFLLTATPPFPDDDVTRKLDRKQTTDPVPVHALRPDVPWRLSAVIQRMLARNLADRFPTPAAVAEALEPWADPGPDFPARLFRPWKPTGADSLGQPTDPGRDHDPTPLPATRRIVRPRTGFTPNPNALNPAGYSPLVVGEVNPKPMATEDAPPTVRLTPRSPLSKGQEDRQPPCWWRRSLAALASLFRRGANREPNSE